MANAIAPKVTAPLKGTLAPNYSTVSYGLNSDVVYGYYPNFSEGYGSTDWRNGIEVGGTANGSEDNTVYYAIYSDRTTQGLAGTNLAVGWGITQNTGIDTAILDTVNRLPAMSGQTPHASFSDAMDWLVTGGYFVCNRSTYPMIGFDDPELKFAYDPTFMASYPWTGGNLYELTGNSSNPAVLTGSCTSIVDTSSGATPYLQLQPNLGNEGYVKISDDVANSLSGLNTIVFSFWAKANNFTSDQALFYIPNNGPANAWFSVRCSNTTGQITLVADPRAVGLPYTKSLNPINSGTFYLFTFALDLVNDELYVAISDTSSFGSVFNGNNTAGWGGSGSSNSPSGQLSGFGAIVDGGGSYISEGLDGYLGSLHIHQSSSSSYNFSSTMAQKIWEETKIYY